MKKTIFTCFTGILLTWTIAGVSYSQSSNSIARLESSHAKFISLPEEINAADNPVPDMGDKSNVKAVKNFTKAYKNVTNAKWFKLNNGYVVYFTDDDSKTKVFYNKRGNFEWMIRSYYEDKLPGEIRRLVKSTYYDFTIYHVNEVSADGIIAYVVKIEDKTSWKTIKVVNGEMEVTEEYFKG